MIHIITHNRINIFIWTTNSLNRIFIKPLTLDNFWNIKVQSQDNDNMILYEFKICFQNNKIIEYMGDKTTTQLALWKPWVTFRFPKNLKIRKYIKKN